MQYITMQNKVVWDLLRRDGHYVADAQLSRERRDYSADAKQLGGATPIWVWYYPDLSVTQLSLGDMFEDLRCEMSLQQEGCFDDFYMFELEIDYAAPTGITHNASPYTRVIHEIKLSDVVAVYTVSDSPVDGWYYKTFDPIYVEDFATPMFQTRTDIQKLSDASDTVNEYFKHGDFAKCLKCDKYCNTYYEGACFCSVEHASRYKRSFIQKYLSLGLDIYQCSKMWNALPFTLLYEVTMWELLKHLSGKYLVTLPCSALSAVREWESKYIRT